MKVKALHGREGREGVIEQNRTVSVAADTDEMRWWMWSQHNTTSYQCHTNIISVYAYKNISASVCVSLLSLTCASSVAMQQVRASPVRTM